MRLNGNEISKTILTELRKRVSDLQKKGVTPHLSVLLVGNDPASVTYINQKSLRAEDIGAKVTLIEFPESITTEELLQEIRRLNHDQLVHGVIIQRPLPPHIDSVEVDYAVKPEKDVDAFHPETLFTPPIALAIRKILETIYTEHFKNDTGLFAWLQSKSIVIVGKGKAGGRPIMQYFDSLQIPYKPIDSKTTNSDAMLKEADIIISAVGKPGIITKAKIKNGVILISVGLKKVKGKLEGDYNEQEVADSASFYTPSPGGVGPVNVATLMANLISAAEQTI